MSGQAIARLRQKYGLTRAEFAALLGVSAPTVFRWETGAAAPSGVALSILCVMRGGSLKRKAKMGLGRGAAAYRLHCLLLQVFEN